MHNHIADLEKENFVLQNRLKTVKAQLSTFAKNTYLPSRQGPGGASRMSVGCFFKIFKLKKNYLI
jgi:hypothetical protein